ncbi:MAG: GAF domain-containing protein [Pseudomonadota bacterium]
MIVDETTALDILEDLAVQQASSMDAVTVFDAAAAAAAALLGQQLFTIMVFHADVMEVERVYSSRPHEYPVGGRKQKHDTEWGRRVLESGEPYIGRSIDDIRRHFHDHMVIEGLGLSAILNMPVRIAGKTIGTMNLLDATPHYCEADLATAGLIAAIIAPRLQIAAMTA